MLWQSSTYTRREALCVAMPHTLLPTVGFAAAGSADEQISKPNRGSGWRG